MNNLFQRDSAFLIAFSWTVAAILLMIMVSFMARLFHLLQNQKLNVPLLRTTAPIMLSLRMRPAKKRLLLSYFMQAIAAAALGYLNGYLNSHHFDKSLSFILPIAGYPIIFYFIQKFYPPFKDTNDPSPTPPEATSKED